MPVVSFESLPDSSRVWVFASDRPLTGDGETLLLRSVDEHLANWKAHGAPLTVSRQWRDARFLAVAVDQSTAGATGCSIDGLFRVLQTIQVEIGANLIGGGRIFYRDPHGAPQSTARADVGELAKQGTITPDTVVFDTSLADLGTFRACFERPAKDTWVASLLV